MGFKRAILLSCSRMCSSALYTIHSMSTFRMVFFAVASDLPSLCWKRGALLGNRVHTTLSSAVLGNVTAEYVYFSFVTKIPEATSRLTGYELSPTLTSIGPLNGAFSSTAIFAPGNMPNVAR